MAIKTETSTSTSFMGICMPRILTLSSPISLGIAAEMEQENMGTVGWRVLHRGTFAVTSWKRRNKSIQIKQRNCSYPSKDQLVKTDLGVTENRGNKMLHLRKFLGIIEALISLCKELSLRLGRALVYFFKYIKTYNVKKKIGFGLCGSRG